MDFSSLNPNTSNALNLCARNNDTVGVKRLLKKINPNCVDNRGWTCLHEAAANNSYESLLIILKHKACRPLAETHEGHTALYLACRHQSSITTITALLESIEDIANYGSTESVTPLHVVSALGRLDIMQLLIDYDAMINVQDFDGDTPLHDASLKMKYKAVELLLHAGAYSDIKNRAGLTAFHLACGTGCLKTVQTIAPFVSDIDVVSKDGDTPLAIATMSGNVEIVKFLLASGADPNIRDEKKKTAIDIAQSVRNYEIFKILFEATSRDHVNHLVVLLSCKPHYFSTQILEYLLESDLDMEFFNTCQVTFCEGGQYQLCHEYSPMYSTIIPLGSYLECCEYVYNVSVEKFQKLFYLFLMRGLQVNAYSCFECPALVNIHYRPHSACFEDVFHILLEHGCNVDYCSLTFVDSGKCLPDAFIASLNVDPTTLTVMLPYSLLCEPGFIINICGTIGILGRIPQTVQIKLLSMIDISMESINIEAFQHYVPCLKHLCRLQIREKLRKCGISTTHDFFNALRELPLPPKIKDYLHYT